MRLRAVRRGVSVLLFTTRIAFKRGLGNGLKSRFGNICINIIGNGLRNSLSNRLGKVLVDHSSGYTSRLDYVTIRLEVTSFGVGGCIRG